MARAEDYRRYAAECLVLAQRTENPNDRARLVDMANAFNQLALKAAAADNSEKK